MDEKDTTVLEVPKTKIRINKNLLMTVGASLAAVALGVLVTRLKSKPEVVAAVELVKEPEAA